MLAQFDVVLELIRTTSGGSECRPGIVSAPYSLTMTGLWNLFEMSIMSALSWYGMSSNTPVSWYLRLCEKQWQ